MTDRKVIPQTSTSVGYLVTDQSKSHGGAAPVPSTSTLREQVAAKTREVRDYYIHGQFSDVSERDAAKEFDRWLAAHDAEVKADAWDEGASSRQCHCAAWSEYECACGNYPSEPNPYRTPHLTQGRVRDLMNSQTQRGTRPTPYRTPKERP